MNGTMEQVRDRLLAYLRQHVAADFQPERDRLLDFLDSVAILQLVMFLEQDLGVSLDMSQIDLEAFATLDSLAEIVQSHTRPGGAAVASPATPATSVRLQPLGPEDFELAARWLSEPMINKWLSAEWRGKKVGAAVLGVAARSPRNKMYLVLDGTEKCGLACLSDIDPDDRVAMVWYLRGEPYKGGKGLISSAVRELARLAFETLGLRALYAWTVGQNVKSQRVLERSGFRQAGRLRSIALFDGVPTDRVYFDLLPQDLK